MGITGRERRLSRGYVLAITAVFVIALAMRLPAIGNRPMHADEAVHAVKFAQLWLTGDYRYDPGEFHGPTLYYMALPIVAAEGRKTFAQTVAADYRLVPAIIGSAMVLVLPLLTDALGGRKAIVIAGLLFAVSPAFVFFSDYYIQETPLVAFTIATAAFGWRYYRRPIWPWAFAAGISFGLSIATKETVTLSCAAALVALATSHWTARSTSVIRAGTLPKRGPRDLAVAVGAAVAVAAYVLTNRFERLSALPDYFHALTSWTHRGAIAELHRHGPAYYFRVLFFWHVEGSGAIYSEAFIGVPAAAGLWMAFFRRGEDGTAPISAVFLRAVGVYTLVLTAAYSCIPYKTPWCVLGIDAGLVLLAGAGASALITASRGAIGKVILCGLLVAGIGQLAWQAHRDAGLLCSDSGNPYVYAGTAPEVNDLVDRLGAVATATGDGAELPIQVCVRDGYYWPLPWYLRGFSRVGYWTTELPATPQLEGAAVVIASTDFDDELTRRLSATYIMVGYSGLRVRVPVEVWIRMDCWRAYLKRHRPLPGDD